MASIEKNVWQSMLLLHEQFCDPNRNTVDIFRFHDLFIEHISTLVSSIRDISSQASPTFKFWDMFLHAVEVMLIDIRAKRDGDWQLHLQSVSSMLPYFFVTNKTNYARWTPVYLLDMLNIPDEVRSAFESGKFAVKQKAGGFNGVWSDMTTEKTIIRVSKGTGGIVGFTTQKSALLRWTFTRHIRNEM